MTKVKEALHQLYDDLESAINLLIEGARAEGYLAGYKDARNERDYDPLGVDYAPPTEKGRP
jgi:hypothetical protein